MVDVCAHQSAVLVMLRGKDSMENLMQNHLQQAGLIERGLGDVDYLLTHDSVAKDMAVTTIDNANLKAGKTDGESAVGGVDDLDDLTAQEVHGVVHADLGVAEGSLASAASTGCSVHDVWGCLYPQSPAPERCEARVSLANGLPPAPHGVQQVDVVALE